MMTAWGDLGYGGTGAVTLLLLVVSTSGMGVVAWQLQPASAIGWVGVVGGVLGPPALWLAWASYRYDRAEADTGLTLEQVADQIAAAVRDQWTAEAELRRLNDPYSIPVQWQPADPGLVEDWSALVRLATTGGAGWPFPPPARTWAADPAGLGGVGNEQVDVLRRVPTACWSCSANRARARRSCLSPWSWTCSPAAA